MIKILIAVAIVAITGLVAGLGLAIASVVMAVPKDEKAEKIRECLRVLTAVPADFRGATVMPPLSQRVKRIIPLFVLPAEMTPQRQ